MLPTELVIANVKNLKRQRAALEFWLSAGVAAWAMFFLIAID